MENDDNSSIFTTSKRKLRGRELFTKLISSEVSGELEPMIILNEESTLEKIVEAPQVDEKTKSKSKSKSINIISKIENVEAKKKKTFQEASTLKSKVQGSRQEIDILEFKYQKIKESYNKLIGLNKEYQAELVEIEKEKKNKESKLTLLEGQYENLNLSLMTLKNKKRRMLNDERKVTLKLIKKEESVRKLALVINDVEETNVLSFLPPVPSL